MQRNSVMENVGVLVRVFGDQAFSIPVSHVAIVIAFCCWCMLYGKHKAGFLASFAFIFYWGFIATRLYWVSLMGDNPTGLILYIFAGLGIVLVAVYSLFQESH